MEEILADEEFDPGADGVQVFSLDEDGEAVPVSEPEVQSPHSAVPNYGKSYNIVRGPALCPLGRSRLLPQAFVSWGAGGCVALGWYNSNPKDFRTQRVDLINMLTNRLQRTPEELGPEWTAEISRRISAVSRGESKLIPGDEVDARIRRALERA